MAVDAFSFAHRLIEDQIPVNFPNLPMIVPTNLPTLKSFPILVNDISINFFSDIR
jgi:hypothetical protein